MLRFRTRFNASLIKASLKSTAASKAFTFALLLPVAAMTALSPQAQAQVDCYKGEETALADVHLHRCSGWYAGLGAGMSFLEPNIVGGAPETLDKTSDLLLPTVFVGYDIARHWSVEAHYSRQGEATFESGAAIGYQHYGASALFHFPSHLPGWHVLGKLGLSRLDTEVASGRDDNGPFNLAQVKNTSLSFGAGVEYMDESNWGARLEAFSVDDDSNQITLSVIKRFGRHIDLPEPAPEPIPEPEPEPEIVKEPEPEAPVCLVPDSVLDGIYFVTNSADLTEGGITLLTSIVEKLTEYPGVQLAVRAYTDSRGSEDYNLQLSIKRAETVKTFLASKGLTDVDAQGLGEVNPIADNASEEGRAKNRRVEIDIVSRECN